MDHLNSETRAIDIWGNWQDQESKLITYNHGSTNLIWFASRELDITLHHHQLIMRLVKNHGGDTKYLR